MPYTSNLFFNECLTLDKMNNFSFENGDRIVDIEIPEESLFENQEQENIFLEIGDKKYSVKKKYVYDNIYRMHKDMMRFSYAILYSGMKTPIKFVYGLKLNLDDGRKTRALEMELTNMFLHRRIGNNYCKMHFVEYSRAIEIGSELNRDASVVHDLFRLNLVATPDHDFKHFIKDPDFRFLHASPNVGALQIWGEGNGFFNLLTNTIRLDRSSGYIIPAIFVESLCDETIEKINIIISNIFQEPSVRSRCEEFIEGRYREK